MVEIHARELLPVEDVPPTVSFVLHCPFDSALNRIRQAVLAEKLCIAAEIDTAQRVKRTLQMYVSPCRVLLIDNPTFLLETTAIDRASAIFIPLHLVVSGAGSRTVVHMLAPGYIQHSSFPIGIRAPVMRLQHQLGRTLGRIAERAVR